MKNYTIESISQQIRDRVEEKFQTLLNKLAVNLAYDFMFRPKYSVTHECDPPWDYSGRLIRVQEGFSLEDYACVGDFIEEHTGNSTASYVSGCGFFHDTYEEKYHQLISEFIFDCYNEVLSEIDVQILIDLLLKNGCEISSDKNDIIQTITDFELFEEPFWYHFDIIERIKPISFKLMILRGKNEAINQYNNEMQSMRKRQEELNIKKETANKLWDKIQKLYRLHTGKALLRIEMKDYAMFKDFLDDNEVSKEERELLADHMSHYFSQRVCYYLRNSVK